MFDIRFGLGCKDSKISPTSLSMALHLFFETLHTIYFVFFAFSRTFAPKLIF